MQINDLNLFLDLIQTLALQFVDHCRNVEMFVYHKFDLVITKFVSNLIQNHDSDTRVVICMVSARLLSIHNKIMAFNQFYKSLLYDFDLKNHNLLLYK